MDVHGGSYIPQGLKAGKKGSRNAVVIIDIVIMSSESNNDARTDAKQFAYV